MSHVRIIRRILFIGLGIALVAALAATRASAQEEDPLSGSGSTVLTLSRTSVDVDSGGTI